MTAPDKSSPPVCVAQLQDMQQDNMHGMVSNSHSQLIEEHADIHRAVAFADAHLHPPHARPPCTRQLTRIMARLALPADWLFCRKTDTKQANDVMAMPNSQNRKNCSHTLLARKVCSCRMAPAGRTGSCMGVTFRCSRGCVHAVAPLLLSRPMEHEPSMQIWLQALLNSLHPQPHRRCAHSLASTAPATKALTKCNQAPCGDGRHECLKQPPAEPVGALLQPHCLQSLPQPRLLF